MAGAALLVVLAASASAARLAGLNAAVVGGGPAGLLLAHKLLEGGGSVRLYENRQDPRVDSAPEGRAYALGLGLRGRTAIRAADEALWQAVAEQGFGSDRFTLHLPFGPAFDLRRPDPSQEPSVLIYQTALCSALLNELEKRYEATGRLQLVFCARVTSVDVVEGSVATEAGGRAAGFDLVAGCDGVSSAVRAAMQAASDGLLDVETATLPGSLKVVRLPRMPAALASDAVHLVPGSGGLAAFLEPTAGGVCALISWRGNGGGGGSGGGGKGGEEEAERVDPADIVDAAEAQALLASAFPTLCDELDQPDVGKQWVEQRASGASTVRCSSHRQQGHKWPPCTLAAEAPRMPCQVDAAVVQQGPITLRPSSRAGSKLLIQGLLRFARQVPPRARRAPRRRGALHRRRERPGVQQRAAGRHQPRRRARAQRRCVLAAAPLPPLLLLLRRRRRRRCRRRRRRPATAARALSAARPPCRQARCRPLSPRIPASGCPKVTRCSTYRSGRGARRARCAGCSSASRRCSMVKCPSWRRCCRPPAPLSQG